MVQPSDERAKLPGDDPLWCDTWQLDFAHSDGTLGGFLHLSLWPAWGVAWWWAHLCTPDGLVAVRDHEVGLPRVGLEIRADGLWGEMVCETPLEHWSYGLEAFGVRYDDPAEALGAEWGERVAVGLDLEWETLGPPLDGPGPGPGPGGLGSGYTQAGSVRGEILLGADRLPLDGVGCRSRRWGRADWWSAPWRRWLGAVAPSGAFQTLAAPGALPVEILEESTGPGGLPERASYLVDGRPVDCEILAVAPVLLTAPDRRPARLLRSLVRVRGGPEPAVGWLEWLER